jgi:RNA polymerase sigma-70 factor (ECF subfamily)
VNIGERTFTKKLKGGRKVEDAKIVEMFFSRDEQAINETEKKYGKYLSCISFNVLRSRLSAEECVNETYLKAWDNIPPHNPERLSTFLGKIVRNLSISRLSYEKAKKRNGNGDVLLSELEDCIPSCDGDVVDSLVLKNTLNEFLKSLYKSDRIIFVRRYWYASSIKEIAVDYQLSQSKVKVSLFRSRKKLKEYLEKEGIAL